MGCHYYNGIVESGGYHIKEHIVNNVLIHEKEHEKEVGGSLIKKALFERKKKIPYSVKGSKIVPFPQGCKLNLLNYLDATRFPLPCGLRTCTL